MEAWTWIWKRGVIVRMSDGWSHMHHEVRVLCMLEKSSHDVLARACYVCDDATFKPAFVSPGNRGGKGRMTDAKCATCHEDGGVLRSTRCVT